MNALNVRRADAYPRVTESIESIIRMIEKLVDKGHAYVADDGIYFEIDTAPEKYGTLTGQTLQMVRSGAGGRVDKTGLGKRDHRDFALWKFAKEGEPSWESPFGTGRPGWHIECSAMVFDHFGEQVDIHGGGSDLMFPHHEAEIFQSECCHGIKPFARHWMHNGMINIDGEKMSKSLGNFWTITEAIDAFEMEKDAMLQTDTIANALAGAMLPFASEKVTSLKTTPAMASQPGIGIGEAADLVGNLNVPMDVFTETIPGGFKPNKELISAITGLGKETLDELDFSDKDIVAGLLRALGPQAYSAFATPKLTVDPLYQPQFRNPFGGF